MKVNQWVFRNIIVDYMAYCWNINSPCCKICSYKYVLASSFESIHCIVSLFLRKISMNGDCFESFLLQFSNKSLRSLFGGRKNNRLLLLPAIDKVTQMFELLTLMDYQIGLIYSVKAQ